MKKIIFFILLILLNLRFASFAASAATAQSQKEDGATASGTLDRIEKIKELVASRVAELKLVEKRGFLGTVKESSNTQIIILNNKNVQKVIDIDELTKFEDSAKAEFGISDVKGDDLLSVVGLYNKDTKRLLARVVSRVKSLPTQFDGIVVSSDAKAFEIKSVNDNGERKTVSVERTTKTFIYSTSGGLLKSGFSKIEKGKRILVTGFLDLDDKDILIASRLIQFDDVPPSPLMKNFMVAAP